MIVTTTPTIGGKKISNYLGMSSLKYWRLGPAVGDCWNVGKSLKGK